jgi:hypothetical protein
MPQGEGGIMSKIVMKSDVKQPQAHTKTVLSPEHLASIRKGKASLAASRLARFKAEAGTRKSK